MTVFTRITLCSLILFSIGCRRDAVEVYRVPKEAPTLPLSVNSMAPMQNMPGLEMPQEVKSRIRWKAPAEWEEQKPTTMRVGSFLVKDANGQSADVSVVPLSGDAGGDLANVNRWRGQIQLSPMTDDELSKSSSMRRFGKHSMKWIDFEHGGKRITAAIAKEGEVTWFFKMTGDSASVSNAHPAFQKFLTSVEFHEHD